MDLNYLLLRQQVERTRAEAADCDQAKDAHEELAKRYEAIIYRKTDGNLTFPREGVASRA
jgi:hypothetical protein